MIHRASGSIAALRGLFRGRPWYVQAVIVASDTPDELRLAVLPGAECQIPRELAANGHKEPRDSWRWDAALSGNWELDLWRWRDSRVLMFLRPGDPYAVYLFWSHESGDFLGGYVNFQRPFVRSAPGFDTHDLELDLVVAPDGTSVWKDEEGYAEGVRRGAISADEAAAVEDARLTVQARIAAKEGPFDPDWRHWKPEAAWLPPELPRGWDEV